MGERPRPPRSGRSARAGRTGRPAGFSRLDRVNESLREVLAAEMARIDDEDLELTALTGVEVDPDLRHAQVWFDTLGEPDRVAATLERHRIRLQAAVGRDLRMKRTPGLAFGPDPAIAIGTRVEEILRGLHPTSGEPPDATGKDGIP